VFTTVHPSTDSRTYREAERFGLEGLEQLPVIDVMNARYIYIYIYTPISGDPSNLSNLGWGVFNRVASRADNSLQLFMFMPSMFKKGIGAISLREKRAGNRLPPTRENPRNWQLIVTG
jgi:hypothetical protein